MADALSFPPPLQNRFQNHPLVVANPTPIRFYAGAPLIASNGHRLGAMWGFTFLL